MLFNTLTFAKFFAIVFLSSWVLVNRRFVPLLPWVALGGYVAFAEPTFVGAGIAAIGFALSIGLVRFAGEHETPPLKLVIASVVVNYLGLSWLTYGSTGLDPLLLGLRTLGVPLVANWVLLGPALVATPVAAVLLLRAPEVRKIFLLLASYVFYAAWNPAFVTLIWISTATDWFAARAMHAAPTKLGRLGWLILSLAVNLGLLGFFKYFYFFNDSASALLGWAGYEYKPWALDIVLPVGISFYTFQTLSYTIDVYRGKSRPWHSALDFALYVTYFPQLVAGPIVRPDDLLPQLSSEPRWNPEEGSEGLFLIAAGLVKKVAIGDYLAVNLVDRVFDAPTQYSALECYAGVLGYAVQIYCDFSGYTDIAIGIALLLGIRMPLNFNAPYKAPEIVDFWRRWHISLSSWLRDYLYISLGGNRRGRARTYLNLMITMLLGGLWHGAGWSFVVWGGLHGWALSVTRMFGESKSGLARALGLVLPVVAAGPIFGGSMSALLWSADLFWSFARVGWFLGGALALGALYHDWAKRHPEASRPATILYDKRRNLHVPGMPRFIGGWLLGMMTAAVCYRWILLYGRASSEPWWSLPWGVGIGGGTVVVLAVGALYYTWARRYPEASGVGTALSDAQRRLAISGMPGTLGGRLFSVVAAAATFHVVCAGWIFFRAQSLQAAAVYFTQLLTLTNYHPNLHGKVLVVLAIGLFSHWMPEWLYILCRESFIKLPALAQGVALLAAAWILREMASAEAVPFVYFQF